MSKTEYLYYVTEPNGVRIFTGEREAAYTVAAQGELRTVHPIQADQAFFEVSAHHMNHVMRGHGAQIFPVKSVEANTVGGRGFDAFAILDTSGFPAMHSKEWTVATARGRFVPNATPDGACVASHGEGKHVGYSESGPFIVSFPAQLNGGRIPELDDVPAILAGCTVAAAMTEFNRANVRRLADKMNAEKLDWLEYPACDEFILLADVGGIFIADAVTHEHFSRVADCWIDEQSAERAAYSDRTKYLIITPTYITPYKSFRAANERANALAANNEPFGIWSCLVQEWAQEPNDARIAPPTIAQVK